MGKSLDLGKVRNNYGLLEKSNRQTFVDYIRANPATSAMPMELNKRLGFNLSTNAMHHMIAKLRNEGWIYEINGKYWYHEDLPKELEKYL